MLNEVAVLGTKEFVAVLMVMLLVVMELQAPVVLVTKRIAKNQVSNIVTKIEATFKQTSFVPKTPSFLKASQPDKLKLFLLLRRQSE